MNGRNAAFSTAGAITLAQAITKLSGVELTWYISPVVIGLIFTAIYWNK